MPSSSPESKTPKMPDSEPPSLYNRVRVSTITSGLDLLKLQGEPVTEEVLSQWCNAAVQAHYEQSQDQTQGQKRGKLIGDEIYEKVALSQKEQEKAVMSYTFDIQMTSPQEMLSLNENFRNVSGSTNVLAFPTYAKGDTIYPPHQKSQLAGPNVWEVELGSIALCPAVIAEEAPNYHRDFIYHLQHLTIHGALHLLGHDHHEKAEQELMQMIEDNAMHALGSPPPWNESAISTTDLYKP